MTYAKYLYSNFTLFLYNCQQFLFINAIFISFLSKLCVFNAINDYEKNFAGGGGAFLVLKIVRFFLIIFSFYKNRSSFLF